MPTNRRPKNAMNQDEYKALASVTALPWRQWEEKTEMVFRANGWKIYRERVVPRKAFDALRLSPATLGRIMSLVQKLGRRKGWADLYVVKEYHSAMLVPDRLLQELPQAHRYMDTWTGPIAIHGMVECKTGAAEESEEQLEWLGFAQRCPGMFSLTARPTEYAELVALAGGVHP